MNRIVLLGRLVKDPEVRITPAEHTVCTFTLAVDRPFTGQDGKREADFINVVSWNKTAEIVGNYVLKGQRLLVEGRLQIRGYSDREGKRRYATEVIAERVEFIERKEKTPQNQSQGFQRGFASMGEDVTGEQAFQFDEEIPF